MEIQKGHSITREVSPTVLATLVIGVSRVVSSLNVKKRELNVNG